MDYNSWFTGIGVRYSSLQHRLCHCAQTCLDFDQLSALYWLNKTKKLRSLLLLSCLETMRIRSQRNWGIMTSRHVKIYLNFVRFSIKTNLERRAVQPAIQIQSALIILVHGWLCQWLMLIESCTLSINFYQDGLSFFPFKQGFIPLHSRKKCLHASRYMKSSQEIDPYRGRWRLVKSYKSSTTCWL